jgi:S-adenosylmethionine uptake transporter
VPSVRILVGSGIIVFAGLFIFHREKMVGTVPPEVVPRSFS